MKLSDRIKFNVERKLSKILKPQLQLIVRLFVGDKLVLEKYGKSVTANFLQFIYSDFNSKNDVDFAVSTIPFAARDDLIRIDGTSVSTMLEMDLTAEVADDSHGMLLGTGTTPPTAEDFVLETPITEGAGVGELNHLQQQGLVGTGIVGLVTSFTLQRIFSNNSGNTISPTELAIYFFSAPFQFCIFRETFSAVNIPDTQNLTAQIIFESTT